MAGRTQLMLRSGSTSAPCRLSGYLVAVACLGLFVWMFVAAVVAAVEVEHASGAAWILGLSLSALAFVTVTVIYVSRRPFTGGYALVAMASVVSAVVCLMAFFPLLVW